ncbi:signal peptidase I [Candidatus Dojkabacteria bacterium]|nr:signal peptidase I [Candidatus Dojkabacteria bacterium]
MSEFELRGDKSPEQSPQKNPIIKFFSSILWFIQPLLISFLIAVFAWLFLATPHEVLGSSMEPNIHDKSFVVASKQTYNFRKPNRGEIVIFERTEYRDYIKRVIGLPGETIAIKDCHFYINGKLLDESVYISPDICTPGGAFLKEGDENQFVIPEGYYFLVGDNRTGSTDSRDIGAVSLDLFKGKASIVFSSGPDRRIFFIKEPEYK